MILMNNKKESSFDMKEKQKKDDSNTPYLSNKTTGSGLPDHNTMIQKFTHPSTNYFNMSMVKKPIHRAGYHVVNSNELRKLNHYASELVDVSKFYKDKLSEGKIFYVYKSSDKVLKTFGAKYGVDNFSHLTGIIFDRKRASEMLSDLASGNLSQNAILVKNDGTTFDKLAVIDKLKSLNSVEIKKLSDIKNVRQAKQLEFMDAISDSNNYLVAYRYFEPHISRPISLINLNKARKGYSDYSKIPPNQVLAVLSETKNKMNGVSLGTLSINHEYLKEPEQLIEITRAMQKIVMNDYQQEKQKEIKQNLIKKKYSREH